MSKNNETATLCCASNVTIKKCKNGVILNTYKYHNTVTKNLFTGLSAFLQNFVTSKDSHSNYIPKYLGIGSGTNPLDVNSTRLNNEFEINRIALTTNRIIDANNIISIPFEAIIPYSSIPQGGTLNELGLFPVISTKQIDTLLAGIAPIYVLATEFKTGTKYYIKNADGTYSEPTEQPTRATFEQNKYYTQGIELTQGQSLIVEWNINLQTPSNGGNN